ncbi:MAG: hypothetical protein H6712_05750 [Myxococcales bacterium]|nr:hypothetical protein [Myxococcales bacterium]MCB9713339.1 hypothetical protein [Myxococcales bacterium]
MVGTHLLAVVLALAPTPEAGPTAADEGAAASEPRGERLPDLGTIRYHDPLTRGRSWLGVDVHGVGLPASNDLGRPVWMAAVTPAWAHALSSRLTLGGRHEMSWYDASNIRLRIHSHELQLSGRLMRDRPRLRDRPAVGMEVHDVSKSVVDGVEFRLGGIRDFVLQLGYGLEHDLGRWIQLGWRVDARAAWVFTSTQRQLRASLRAALLPRPNHRLSLELVGFYVNRDAEQAGQPTAIHSVHGQVVAEYVWMGPGRVGLVAGARYATSFRSGEAPLFELREESLQRSYAEMLAGLRVVWE